MDISGEIKTEGEGKPIEEGFRDSSGNRADGTEAIFPIIQVNNGQPWQAIGTGFFISNNGMFATAKHVVLDNTGQLLQGLYGVQLLRRENRIILREVKKVSVHSKGDVAVGFLYDQRFAQERVQTVNKFFELTKEIPDFGSIVATMAFPKGELTGDANEFILTLKTEVFTGTLDEYHPDGRDACLLPGCCFQTSMSILGGASGGPVAFGGGSIFGINSTGYDDIPVSFISSINDLLELEVHNIRLPGGEQRDRVSLAELVELGLIYVR